QYGLNTQAWVEGGTFLLRVGRAHDAISYLERARAAEPLVGGIALYLGDAYAASGALDVAFAELDRGLQFTEATDIIRGTALMTALATRNRGEIDKRIASLSANQINSAINVA